MEVVAQTMILNLMKRLKKEVHIRFKIISILKQNQKMMNNLKIHQMSKTTKWNQIFQLPIALAMKISAGLKQLNKFNKKGKNKLILHSLMIQEEKFNMGSKFIISMDSGRTIFCF